jgi:hypothetical protein
MTNETLYSVGVASMSWTLHFDGSKASSARRANAALAITPRKHPAAAARFASVDRGTI